MENTTTSKPGTPIAAAYKSLQAPSTASIDLDRLHALIGCLQVAARGAHQGPFGSTTRPLV